jgi:hypothetical protein
LGFSLLNCNGWVFVCPHFCRYIENNLQSCIRLSKGAILIATYTVMFTSCSICFGTTKFSFIQWQATTLTNWLLIFHTHHHPKIMNIVLLKIITNYSKQLAINLKANLMYHLVMVLISPFLGLKFDPTKKWELMISPQLRGFKSHPQHHDMEK